MIPAPRPSELFELRHAATDRVFLVVVPWRRFFAIDGLGPTEAAGFRLASETLRMVGSVLRGHLGRRGVTVRPAARECVWWIQPSPEVDELPRAFADRRRWQWQQLIEVPRAASTAEATAAIDAVRRQARRETPIVHLAELEERTAAQILHVGEVGGEPESVWRLYAAVGIAGMKPAGRLHEIVLVDPARVPTGRGRSILRVPVHVPAEHAVPLPSA